MAAEFMDFIHLMFTGPVWPASLLICFVLAYSVLVLLGLMDLDLDAPDVSDGGADFVESGASLGAATIRWLNLDSIPIFVWLGFFGFCWWVLSLGIWALYDQNRYSPDLVPSILLASRNLVIAVVITKLVTNPMRKWFERGSPYRAEHLIGNVCEIDTSEATPTFGRARYRTDGAPLLLNIRTTGETLVKGQQAQIVDFEPTSRIYFVQSVEAQE